VYPFNWLLVTLWALSQPARPFRVGWLSRVPRKAVFEIRTPELEKARSEFRQAEKALIKWWKP